MSSAARQGTSSLRYLRDVRPLHFPGEEREDEKVPERPIHLRMRTALWLIVEHAYGREHATGSEQFMYFNARDPRRCCAPDVWLKLNAPTPMVEVWKTWERGAPELVVEITSPSDQERWTWEEKLERFHEMGSREVVRFDPEGAPGHRLRVWDRIDDDLVERIVEGDASPCLVLGLWWVVSPLDEQGPALRLARDVEGRELLPTPVEDERRKREAAERRVAELEEELAGRGTA